ncbi:hypothetical protein D3C80_1703410 [compost metagenome]
MTLTSVVFFSITLNSLPSGGTITRNAWGRTMRRINLAKVMPRDRPASYWPLSTAPMPARMISAMYAPSFRPRAMIAAWMLPGTMNQPRSRSSKRNIPPAANAVYRNTICTSNGVPRISQT